MVRPQIAGLMRGVWCGPHRGLGDTGVDTTLAKLEDLEDFRWKPPGRPAACAENRHQMTISTFSNGERHVSGNRCERGASLEKVPKNPTSQHV